MNTIDSIQREIDSYDDIILGPREHRYLAALELAKAMCEVPPHLLNLEARLKLAELLKALQR